MVRLRVQMLADIFGIKNAVTDVTENASFGAALLGLLAIGEDIKGFFNNWRDDGFKYALFSK